MKKIFTLIFILCFILVACQIQAPSKDDYGEENLSVEDYYPFLKDTYLTYEGKGMEFAEMESYFDFIKNKKAQIRNYSPGTTMVQVVEYRDGAVYSLFKREEVYGLADYTNIDFDKDAEILLKEPIEKGSRWELPDGRLREITGIDIPIETPSGEYKALEVTTQKPEEDILTKNYYVKGLGIVYSVFESKEQEITVSLENIKKGEEVVYPLRCYYPDFENEKIVYKDFEIAFNTNKEIAAIYTEKFKSSPDDSILPVFSGNTKIISFAYDPGQDVVTVDISKNFVEKMNAGSGLESMIIQSIVNTIGYNFGVEKVVITLEGKLYESGHLLLQEGEYFKVDYRNVESR